MTDKTLTKITIRVYQEDLDVVTAAYADFGQNAILRHLLARLADNVRKEREDAITKATASIRGLEND